MSMEWKKLKSLLKFYKKNNVEIELKVDIKDGLIVKGFIIKNNYFPKKSIIIKSKDKSKIKIFVDDIFPNSVIPVDFSGDSGKKIKNKITRTGISPKLRFEVLRRDKYVCQYCGACGPNVELEVDHKIPVSKGGKTIESNLVTSCIECNRGKGNEDDEK